MVKHEKDQHFYITKVNKVQCLRSNLANNLKNVLSKIEHNKINRLTNQMAKLKSSSSSNEWIRTVMFLTWYRERNVLCLLIFMLIFGDKLSWESIGILKGAKNVPLIAAFIVTVMFSILRALWTHGINKILILLFLSRYKTPRALSRYFQQY